MLRLRPPTAIMPPLASPATTHTTRLTYMTRPRTCVTSAPAPPSRLGSGLIGPITPPAPPHHRLTAITSPRGCAPMVASDKRAHDTSTDFAQYEAAFAQEPAGIFPTTRL